MAALFLVAGAQDRGSHGNVPNIRVQSNLVLINALVTDASGAVVADLDATRFHLFEEGKEQILKFCASEDSPVSIGLILDTSGSMYEKLNAVKAAAIQFVRAANPSDEYFLLEFRNRPEIIIPFTKDSDRLISAIESSEAGGSTALLDAVYLALREIRRGSHPRKALLVISDGLDNHSRHSERETKRLALEADAPIYAINLRVPPPSGNRYTIQWRDSGLLEEISRPTGGRSFAVHHAKNVVSTAERISSEIRHEYVLGYVPANPQTVMKFRHVRVKVESSPGRRLKVSHRAGYYALGR